MRKKMLIITCVSVALAAALWVFYYVNACLILAIVFSTVFYHLGIRLLVNKIFYTYAKKPYNFNSRRLREKSFEAKFYKAIGVRAWKNKLPPFLEELDLTDGLLSIINATCIAESVHEALIPLSYLPLIPIAIFGSLPDIVVLGIISFIFGAIDFLFVAVQRYNRFRFLDAYKRNNGRFNSLACL